MKNRRDNVTKIVIKIVGTIILSIILVILQLIPTLHIGAYSMSFALIPIIIGATLFGIIPGAWLGFVWGTIILISGDAAVFLSESTLKTIITIFLKCVLAGVITGISYKLLEKIHYSVATIISATICPIINSGMFIVCIYLFFKEWLFTILGTSNIYEVMSVFLGINFIVELIVNVFISSLVVILIKTIYKFATKNKQIVPDTFIYPITENKSVADTLLNYKELLEIGAITQKEFDDKKEELLKL